MQDCDEDMRRNVYEIFFKSFDIVLKMIRQASMITLEKWILGYLMAFVSDKNNIEAANIFLEYITLPENTEGIKYSETLLGQLLCLSITPKHNNGPYEFFDQLNSTNLQALNNLSSSLWNNLNYLHESIYALIKCILVIGGETRDKILNWLGNAITKNQKRGQIWNQHSSMVLGNFTTAPDSFMVSQWVKLIRIKIMFSNNCKKNIHIYILGRS
jgi:ubiquitin conjugation factor E4 A